MISLPDGMRGALAIGWATVELERAALELSHLLAPGASFTEVPSSVVLGARCRAGTAADAQLRIVLLEPDSEGRLAATLARHGEGWAASWEERPAAVPGQAAVPRDPAMSAARPGPFGRERLVPGPTLAVPHRLVVDVPSQP